MVISPTSVASAYAAAKTASRIGQKQAENTTASEQLNQFAQNFTATLQQSENTATQAMVADADPHSLVHAMAQTELAIETAVTVRNKVVEAYQEILRMQI